MSAIQDYLNGLSPDEKKTTVAGPAGMQDAAAGQQSGAMQDYLNGLGGSVTPNQQQMTGQQQPTQMTGTFRSWYTGAQQDGTKNGWDTDFQRVFQKGIDEHLKRGNPYDYFTDQKATGVVTWDNAAGAGGTKYDFGDVVVEGKKVGNVYKDFDRHTANVMMGDYLIETGARKGELNNASDIPKAWDEEITNARANATQKAEVFPKAKAFEGAVEQEVRTDADRGAIALGGGVGGAALGGGIGSLIMPGVGTAIGGGIGFGVGAVAAWLNSDSLAYQLARSQEQEKLAAKDGLGANIQSKLSMAAQNTMSIGLSPISNLLQGTYDVVEGGGVGGGKIGGAFYETNEVGDRKAGAMIQAADFAALIGDSALQFASPAGRLAYQAQMSTQITSGVMGLLPGVGQWDQQTLSQNSIWTRQEFDKNTGKFVEKFDLGNSLAGIGNVGIDAVQLGAMSSLSRGVDRLAAATAEKSGVEAATLAKPFRGENWFTKANLSGEQRAALKAGGELEVHSGLKFVLDEGGALVGKAKPTLAMLAPSEGLQTLSAKMLARRDAARRSGAVAAEDLYQAASDLALGQRGLTAILVNAVGEGQEEVAQAYLEPWSQDHTVDGEQVIRAGLAGAASGFGMTAGARIGRPSADLQMFTVGQAAYAAQTNGAQLKYEDWQGMDALQKRTLVKSAGALTESVTKAAFDKIEADRTNRTVGGMVEAAAYEDYLRDETESALKTGAAATDQASPIVMHESSTFRPEAIATSHRQLLQNQQDRTAGATLQLDALGKEIAKVKSASAADPANAELVTKLADLQSEQGTLSRVQDASQTLERTIAAHVSDIDTAYANGNLADAEAVIDTLNVMLEDMFDMTANTYTLVDRDGVEKTLTLSDDQVFAFSKAASRLGTRDPADSKSSWQVLMPQVNKVWSQRGADGIYGVSQIILQAIRGDYDGDKMRELQQLVIDDKGYVDLRSGANILGAAAMPEIGSTKFEKLLATRVMQAWKTNNIPIRSAARAISENIESDLRDRYAGVVPSEVIDAVAAATAKALKSGKDVRKVVLEMMSERAGGELNQFGRGLHWQPGQAKLSNEWYWMANMVTKRMQEFQSAYAEHTPAKGDLVPQGVVAAPSRTTTDTRKGRARRGATDGSTIINELPGSQMFRMFQKLHYTGWETTERGIGFALKAQNPEYLALIQHYEALSQGVMDQRLQRQSPSDQIIGTVMTWLEDSASDPEALQRLGITEMGDLAIIANAGVPQMVYAQDDEGTTRLKYTGKEVTYAQHLLYLALQKFQRENRMVWDRDADLKAAYNNLFALTKPPTQGDTDSNKGNAEMAFVRIFEGVRLYDIVGVDAVTLGVNRTVGQVYRQLVSTSPAERKQQKYAIHSGAYGDSKKGFTIPFGTKAIEGESVTAYKSLVDSLFSAADSTLTIQESGKDKGKVRGRDAKKSRQRGQEIQGAYKDVRALLRRLAPKSGEYTADEVSRIVNANPEFGEALMKTIPKQAMPWVFKGVSEEGRPMFASWFYEVWTQPTAEAAEMSYFRNYVLNSWYAKVRNLDIDFSRGGENAEQKKIAFDSLDSRMHRVIFRLASAQAGQQLPLQNFMTKFNEATDLEKFMQWVNNEEGLNADGAPLLPWMDDVALYDPERAGGGWTSKLSTPTLMEHISDLRSTAQRMIGDLAKSEERAAADVSTALSIKRWYDHLQNPDDITLPADPNDRDTYLQFVELLKQASKRRMAVGPRAMLQHTAHLVHGMYAPAHAKGAIAEQMAAQAAVDAADNAFGFLITAERVLGDLTTHNVDSVSRSPQMILRDGGRMMDHDGSPVQWEMNSVEAMLPLMLEPANHNLMRSVLFDTVIELDGDNVARRKHLMGSTLDEVLKGSTVADLFPNEGNPSLVQAMKFLAKMESELRGVNKHQITQYVTELVLARTTAATTDLSFEEIQSMTVQAYLDMASLLQVIGRTNVVPGEEDPVVLAHRALKEASMVAAIASAYKIDPKLVDGNLTNMRDLVEQEMLKPSNDRISAVQDQLLQSGLTATQRSELESSLKAEESVLAAMQAKIARMFDLNVTDEIVNTYLYTAEMDDVSKAARQTDLMAYVYDHGDLMQAAGPALNTVQMIRNHFGDTARQRKIKPLELTDEAWAELSNVIISVEIQHLLTVSSASKPPPPYPAALKPGTIGMDKRRFWDHSFSYLFDFMAEDSTSGIVEAARALATAGGKVQQEFSQEDVVKKVMTTLMRPEQIGTWGPEVPIQSIESYELLTGASAKPSISMHGLLSLRWGAAMKATERQTTDTVADATVTLTARDLNWMTNGQFHDVEVTAGNGMKYQRPLAMLNNRFAEELVATYVDASGTPQTLDLMTRPNVARTWIPAADDAPIPASRFKEVNITRLDAELDHALRMAHPDVDENAIRAMLNSAQVSMRFVNPDAQPATPEHANSVWHEGTVYYSDGDMGDSLITAFFYGVGGLNARGQQAALDTRKLGLYGIEDYQRPEFGDVQTMEDLAGTDFARMLALKTNVLMDTAVSDGKPIDVHFYNAAYKLMKLKHWVEGVQDGTPTRWSAEQVIAWQMQNPGEDFFATGPLTEAKLWIPSDQVLADMMGDIGFGGVSGRLLKPGVTDDLQSIPRYTSSWTEEMERKFPVKDSQPKSLTDTEVARQSFVQDLRISSFVTPQERTRFQRRVEAMEYKRTAALRDRTQDAQRTTFDPVKNRQTNANTAIGWVKKADVNMVMPDYLAYLTAEQKNITERTATQLQQYLDEQQAKSGALGASFWIFQETGTSSTEEGRLTKGDLTGGLTLVPGEVVFFDTAGYRDMDPTAARELAMKRIDFFVNRGVALMIGSSDGNSPLTSELQRSVQDQHRYVRYENNANILQPDVFDEGVFQNVAAATSRLVVPSGVPIARQRLTLLTSDLEVEENTIYVVDAPGAKSKFETFQAAFDLFPVDVHSEFNTANTSDDAEKVLRRLDGLGDEGVAMLRAEALRHNYEIDADGHATTKLKKGVTQAEVDAEEIEFNAAWKRLTDVLPTRVARNKTEPMVGEDFGTGDFVPLINSLTGEILLYRHGYDYPSRQDFVRQLVNQTPGATGERGIVMYSGQRASNATTHRGRVVSIESSPGRGYRMELDIPVQSLGSKIVFEHNGMKYLKTNLPDSIKVPEAPLFGDVRIDGVASLHDTISKEATDGLVTSFQNLFTTFGIDFRQDIKSFFGTASTDEAITMLRKIQRLGNKASVAEIYQLQSLLAGNDAYLSTITGLLPQLQAADIDTSGWTSKLQDPSPEAFIARAMIVYLTSPGSDLDAVLSASGFYVDNPSLVGAESQKMPELFTRAFDLSAPDSQIRAEISKRIDAKLGAGWHLDLNSWELEGQVPGGRTIRGLLQYGEAHVSEDNPLLNLMAQDRKDSQSATRHAALMNMIGTGGFLRTKGKKLDRLDSQRRQDLPESEAPGSLWRDLTFVDASTAGPGSRWQNRTPAEHRFYSMSLQRYAQYRHAIDMSDTVFDEDRHEIETSIGVVANRLGLRKSQRDLVHYWIRQMLHHPAEGADQAAFSDDLSPKDVLGAARTILSNIEAGYLPTYGSVGPSFFGFHDLQILFQANQRDAKAWAPSRIEGDRKSVAKRDDLGEWIAIAFGQAINEQTDFDPIYRLDMAGFMNTYQSVLRSSGYMMDITLDKALQGKLLDPRTNELMSVTMDPTENTRLTEQQIMAISSLEYDDLLRGVTSTDNPNSNAQAAAWRAKRLKNRARWRAKNAVRPVKVQSSRDFLRNGTELINRDPDMHSLQRIVIAMRHGTAMLNPGLYFMMVPEQGWRMFLSEATNALTGQSTLQSVSAVQRGVEGLVDRVTGGRMNLELVQYTPRQIEDMTTLFKTLGNDGAFTSLIIKDMMWKRNPDSPGRIVNWFERYAALGNKWQDPTWGTSQKALARHYVESIMRAINDQPTKYVMSIDNVIAHLQTDPAYFAKNHPDLHKAASNYVVDFRSLKNTPWSLAMKSIYEPWSQSENMGKRFAGTLLKLQGMYATYNMNVLTTMTGMQGYTDMLSVFLEGRRKPGSLLSMWWKARNGEEITDDDYRTFDMSSTLDGVTIANAFIKGGVTQTGLFMLGMAAGGALSGEDEEAKRRRKLTQALNAHMIMDPRRLETDFRNKDSIFLDWLPPQLNAFFRVQGDDGVQGARSMAQMSFLLKPFLSPILGMERFFMTGDFSYITHGFLDATSSLPLFNKNKWDDAVRSANELEALAADEQQAGTPTATKNAMYLLTAAVGVFENMLVENMFVNGIYAGLDQYDRDPSKMVLRDSDGNPQVTAENNARPNDLALKDYVKPDGSVGTGYMKRSPLEANVAAFTENNFTAAATLSLFTGFRKDLLRSEMPVTIRTINMPELEGDAAKTAIILATLNSQKAAGTLERRLSLDEVTAALKGEAMKRKDWAAYNNIDALAKNFYLSPANPVQDPMSFIDKDGLEKLTKSGQAALFKGLLAGTITLDSPEMRGIGITVDERKALEKDFYQDMTRQGVDLGLTLSQAEKRATRLMMGPRDDPSILGFKDILWDKRIPWSADAKYKQLNTTYVQGPDGFPWATGYKRGGAPGFGGFASLFGGLKKPTIGVSDAIDQDGRMNSADMVRNINTGLRGLVPFNDSENIPTDNEQTKAIIDAIKKTGGSDYQSYVPNSNGGSGGGYGGSFYRGSGGGGYSSKGYSPTIYWSRQPTLPRGTNVYGNFARNLFWNNANIRRTTIRRERYQASRGRLNQWQ